MNLRTHVLDVGRGDSIILELPNRNGEQVACIVDCCKFPDTVAYMNEQDISPRLVKLVIATHPHLDHIRGLQPFLEKFEADGVPVSMFWDSGQDHTSETYEGLLRYLSERQDIVTVFPRAGTGIQLEDVEIRVLSPPDPLILNSKSDCNNASIVLKIRYGNAELLLAADAEFANWAHIRVNQPHNMRGQVLKVSHHGSKHGTFLEAIESIGPKYAIISGPDSLDNPQAEFPHPMTVDALRESGVTGVYCTSVHGNIMIESSANGTHTIRTER